MVSMGVLAFLFTMIKRWLPDALDTVALIVFIPLLLAYFFTGILYMIDYFTLGFIKKIKWLARVYYPFYKFFSFITLAGLSRSIYYYLISKFSKKRIRVVYLGLFMVFIAIFLVEFDQHVYYPGTGAENKFWTTSNMYDDERPKSDYIDQVSIPSKFINKPFFPVFLVYNAKDNDVIQSLCADFIPIKNDGFNSRLEFISEGNNFVLTQKDYTKEDFETLLSCHASIYEIAVNDSVYEDLSFHFYDHPAKVQKGLLTVIPTDSFKTGENTLEVRKISLDSVGNEIAKDYALVPFWFKVNE